MNKFLLIGFYSLFSFQAFAKLDLNWLNQNYCSNLIEAGAQSGFYKVNDVLHFKTNQEDYFLQRTNGKYSLSKLSLSPNPAPVRDFVIVDDKIYLATNKGLFEYDLLTGKFLAQINRPEPHTAPRGLYFHAPTSRLYMANEAMGLSYFDLTTRKIIFIDDLQSVNSNGNHSLSIAIVGDSEDHLFIAMTGNTEKGFNGVVVFDPQTNQIISSSEYNRRTAGVIDPYASIYELDGVVTLNNGGWIHHVKKSELLTKKIIKPTWQALPHQQDDYQQYVMIEGDLIFEDGQIKGCGKIYDRANDQLVGTAVSTQ